MTQDISGLGTSVRVISSNTFPVGLEITEFADDADPIDAPALQIADSAMGLNGDQVVWSTANPIPVTLNVITNSEDDRNLSLLFEANRAGRNKGSASDTITMIVIYPDGSVTTLLGGVCREFIPAKSIAGEGRFKTNAYLFSFENRFSI